MFETAGLLATDLLYIFAHLVTACFYLAWNRLLPVAVSSVGFFFSNPASPILMSMLKLHCFVMVCFVLATCFRLTTAEDIQHVVEWSSANTHTLNVSLASEIAYRC